MIFKPKAVRFLRLQLGLSSSDFARKLAVRESTTLSWEKGLLALNPESQMAMLHLAKERSVDLSTLEAVLALVTLVGRGDPETARHGECVSGLAEKIAAFVGEVQFDLAVAGYLLDIGKVMLPPSLLNHPGQLSLDEKLLIQAHVTTSANLARQVIGDTIARYILEHHERMDGTGYPFGLDERQISHGGRILGVCDEFTARISKRMYRRDRQQPAHVLAEMEEGGRFDVAIIDALRMIVEREVAMLQAVAA